MEVLESILYGLISGASHLLPVSPQAHQSLLRNLLGMEPDPLMDLLIHIAVLAALLLGCYSTIARIRRDRRITARMRKSRIRQANVQSIYDIRLLTTAFFPLMAVLLATPALEQWGQNPVLLSVFLLLNGVILYLPSHLRQGNKDARLMTGFDGILIGAAGALSVFPGISLTGAACSAAIIRGADKRQAMNWALLLSIPATVLFIIFDIFALAGASAMAAAGILSYILATLTAFGSAYLSIVLLQYITVRSDLSDFSYYCWGAALLTFFLYLIV